MYKSKFNGINKKSVPIGVVTEDLLNNESFIKHLKGYYESELRKNVEEREYHLTMVKESVDRYNLGMFLLLNRKIFNSGLRNLVIANLSGYYTLLDGLITIDDIKIDEKTTDGMNNTVKFEIVEKDGYMFIVIKNTNVIENLLTNEKLFEMFILDVSNELIKKNDENVAYKLLLMRNIKRLMFKE